MPLRPAWGWGPARSRKHSRPARRAIFSFAAWRVSNLLPRDTRGSPALRPAWGWGPARSRKHSRPARRAIFTFAAWRVSNLLPRDTRGSLAFETHAGVGPRAIKKAFGPAKRAISSLAAWHISNLVPRDSSRVARFETHAGVGPRVIKKTFETYQARPSAIRDSLGISAPLNPSETVRLGMKAESREYVLVSERSNASMAVRSASGRRVSATHAFRRNSCHMVRSRPTRHIAARWTRACLHSAGLPPQSRPGFDR